MSCVHGSGAPSDLVLAQGIVQMAFLLINDGRRIVIVIGHSGRRFRSCVRGTGDVKTGARAWKNERDRLGVVWVRGGRADGESYKNVGSVDRRGEGRLTGFIPSLPSTINCTSPGSRLPHRPARPRCTQSTQTAEYSIPVTTRLPPP